MRTKSNGALSFPARKLGLVSLAALAVSACSSDSDRLSLFGVDQAQPQTVAVVQPGLQPQYVQPQVITPSVQPVTQPAPYTAPSYTAPGYPQTTASIARTPVASAPTVQALPQPVQTATVVQPTYVQPAAVSVQRAPVSAPTAHLAETPTGLVGAQLPQTIQVAAPAVQVQQPHLVYQQPQFQVVPQTQAAPLTTASIGAPHVITPRPLSPDPVTTSSIPPVQTAPVQLPRVQPLVTPASSPGWSATGGTRVTVQPGETLFSMSRRYGVPVDALQRVNAISDPASLRTGQQITIPVYSTAAASSAPAIGVDTTVTGSTGTPRVRAPAPWPRPASLRPITVAQQTASTTPALASQTQQAVPQAGTHVVSAGDTLYSIARRYNMSAQQLIAANQIENPNQIRIGQRLIVTSTGQSLPPVAQLPVVQQTPSQVVAARSYTPPQPAAQPALVEQTAAIQQLAARNDDIAEQTPLQFRWPIRGRVLSTFGTPLNGSSNDGVNIAVPEGASIRAAEEGEVVYAGSELPGFGNLVLIQHRGGYITAYAHNSRLDVQRGDRVQRGDVIARAGATGDVETPQLHFEIRRGTTPVDPAPYLPTS